MFKYRASPWIVCHRRAHRCERIRRKWLRRQHALESGTIYLDDSRMLTVRLYIIEYLKTLSQPSKKKAC